MMNRKRCRWLLWLLPLLLLAAACQGSDDKVDRPPLADDDDIVDDDGSLGPGPAIDDDTTPADDDTDEPPPTDIEWVDCATFFEPNLQAFIPWDTRCGQIQAPWKRNDLDSEKTIPIRFAVVPSTAEVPAGVLAVHLGGPDPNLRNLTLFRLAPRGILADELRGAFHLLFVEGRGSSYSSTPLVCPAEMIGEPYRNQVQFRRLVRQCLDALPAEYNPAYAMTIDSVDDLDDVRQALEIEKLYLFGNSYGARLMLEYLRRHGDNVEAYLFDSMLAPQMSGKHDIDRVLKTLADDCENDLSCPVAAIDIWTLTEQVLTTLDETPLLPLLLGIDGYKLTDVLFHLGDQPQLLAQWPRVLADWREGNTDTLVAWYVESRLTLPSRVDLPYDGETFQYNPYSDNIMCHEFPGWNEFADDYALDRLSPPYVPFDQITWMAAVSCEELALRAAEPPRVDRSAVKSDLPGLVIAPRLDEDTPFVDVLAAIADGLGGAYYVTVNSDHSILIDLGSTQLGLTTEDQQCLRQLVVDWLRAPFNPAERTCVAGLTAPLTFTETR